MCQPLLIFTVTWFSIQNAGSYQQADERAKILHI